MEKYPVENETISYSEKKLRELLDNTCDTLKPTDNFKLELHGVVPSFITQNEVEALAGVELDQAVGATITLGYNTIANTLELQTLRHPLDRSGKNAFILTRDEKPTPTPQYVAFLDINGKTDILGAHREDAPFTHEEITHILEGYGIQDMPQPTDASYQLWRADLLSTCAKGWKSSDEVELFINMTEHSLETTKVGVKEEYIEGSTNSRTKYASRTFDTQNNSGQYRQQMQINLVQTENNYDSLLDMYTTLTETEFEPNILGDNAVKTQRTDEPLTFDEQSFQAFRGILEDTAEYLHQNA